MSATVEGQSCFVPLPKFTFLYLQKKDIECPVCRTRILSLNAEKDGDDWEPIVIWPCGHVAGKHCAEQAAQAGFAGCPLCKSKWTYSQCKHECPPRLLDQVSIHSVPDTLPVGGFIPDACLDCRHGEGEALLRPLFQDTLERIGEVLARLSKQRTRQDEVALLGIIKNFDSLRQAFFPPHVLHQW